MQATLASKLMPTITMAPKLEDEKECEFMDLRWAKGRREMVANA